MHPWRYLQALRRTPVSREIRRIAIPLQLIGFVCIAAAGGDIWFAAQEDVTHQTLLATLLFWGAGESLPEVELRPGSCATRGSRGSGGRHASDERYASCSVFLAGPEAVVPGGSFHFDVHLFGPSAVLEDGDLRGAARWNGNLGVRFGFGTLFRIWAQTIARSWALFFAIGLGVVFLASPRLIAVAARPRGR
jgi:hypothetical protein